MFVYLGLAKVELHQYAKNSIARADFLENRPVNPQSLLHFHNVLFYGLGKRMMESFFRSGGENAKGMSRIQLAVFLA